MISIQQRKPLKALAVFLVFAVAQVYVQLSFAEPASSDASIFLQTQNIIVARLATTGNRAITVNGISAATGATILTGATITTPADTGATVNLGTLGSVDLAPGTTIKLEFDDEGKLKVTLIVGCVIVHANKKTEAEVATEQNGTEKKTDKAAGGVIDACFPAGASGPTIGQGAAAAAGAGAGGSAGATGAAAASSTGIGTAATVAMILGGAGAAVGVALAFRGVNPSVTNPTVQ
jgi:hypothetical protein